MHVPLCSVCAQHHRQVVEPLIATAQLVYPWVTLAADFFQLQRKSNLMAVNSYSGHIKIAHMTFASQLKGIFSYLIWHTVLLDYLTMPTAVTSSELAAFVQSHGFQHITSSPLHLQGNDMVESSVLKIKNLLLRSADAYLAFLMYWSTPLECGFSPAQILMRCNLRSAIPASDEYL